MIIDNKDDSSKKVIIKTHMKISGVNICFSSSLTILEHIFKTIKSSHT